MASLLLPVLLNFPHIAVHGEASRDKQSEVSVSVWVCLSVFLSVCEFMVHWTAYAAKNLNNRAPDSERKKSSSIRKIAKKCTKSEKTRHMFPMNIENMFHTMNNKTYFVTHAKKKRLANTTGPSMQRMLNSSCYVIDCLCHL